MDNITINMETIDMLIDTIGKTHNTIQSEVMQSVSRGLTLRNWIIGYYIVEYEQNGKDRAIYGTGLIKVLTKRLSHIKGMSRSNLQSFRQFYLAYPQIGQSLTGEFKIENIKSQSVTDLSLSVPIENLMRCCSFTHFIELIKIDDELKRIFYEIEIIKGNWSVRELKRQINSLAFERIGVSQDKQQMIRSINRSSEKLLPQQIIKDPYILEFTGLEEKIKYSENDLESELLNHLHDFLLELGNGFCFEARQKRISIDNEHDKIDLVFYHRVLKCHVLIDLKIREFHHSDVGQMNFYLNYYKNEIIEDNDNPPIGLILCANKNYTKVEYATTGLENSLYVSKYKINLPSVKEMEMFLEDEFEDLANE